MSVSHIGMKQPEYVKKKISRALSGEKGFFWRGGLSFEPYSPEFNNILKREIRKRDRYRCQECFRHQDELRTLTNRKYKLLIHHIDYDKGNNNIGNLISLCRNCHAQTNFNRDDWGNYFKDKIGGD